MSSRTVRTRTLSAYGKLPAARDFVWHNCPDGSRRAFRAWLDSAGPLLSAIPGWSRLLFKFRPMPGEAPLLGVVWPSSDAGGLRPFPFALFSEGDRRIWQGASLERELGPAWQACEQACLGLRSKRDEPEMARLLEELDSGQDAAGPAVLSEPDARLSEWVTDVYGKDTEHFVLGLWRWRQLIEQGRADSSKTAFLLPLSRRFALSAQVGSWTHVCQAAGWRSDREVLVLERQDLAACLLTTAAAESLRSFATPAPDCWELRARGTPKNLAGFQDFDSHVRREMGHLSLRHVAELIGPRPS